MRSFFLQTVTQKPAVCHIQGDFLSSTAQRGQTIQVLNENHFEQHNRVHAGTAIVSTVQRLYHVVDLAEVYRSIDFSQQVFRGHQTFGVHDFKYASFHFPTL